MSMGLKLACWSAAVGALAGCQIELLKTESESTTLGEAAATTGGVPTGSAGASGGLGGGGGAPNNENVSNTTLGPLPEGKWESALGNLTGEEHSCAVSYVSETPDGRALIAGLPNSGLFESEDGGETWKPIGVDGDPIGHIPVSIVYDPDDPDIFWEAGIYGDSPYKTEDGGKSFVRLGNLGHTDHISIDFTDPERQTLLLGTHENRDSLYLSTNAGEDWENIASSTPDECVFLSIPHVIDAETFLLGCARGIARSDDAGETWSMVSDIGGTSPPLIADDGSIYWRVEVAGLVRSTDDGKTWDPIEVPGPAVMGAPPIQLPDGRLAMLGQSTVLLSDDRGDTWTPASALLPEMPGLPTGLAYSTRHRAFYVWTFVCNDVVGGDELHRFDFDYEEQ